MARHKKKDESKQNRHHPFPKRDRRHFQEIKIVDLEQHRRWHHLVSDRTPEQAIKYIARNFLPKEMENKILEAIR